MFQFDVPVATPDLPNDVDHVTRATPTLSRAVPCRRMLADVVSTLVEAGEVMPRVGATVSFPKVYVTVKVFEADAPRVSKAVTVKRFAPGWSAIGPADHCDVPEAVPLPPRELAHWTRAIPPAGAAVPDKVTDGLLVA